MIKIRKTINIVERDHMKKKIFVRPITDEPYIKRRKLKNGIVEPGQLKPFSLVFYLLPLTNVGETVIKYTQKKHPDCVVKLYKQYFFRGMHKYWIKISTKDLIIDLKADEISFFTDIPIKFCAIVVEGELELITKYLKDIIFKIQEDTLNRLNIESKVKKSSVIKKYRTGEIYNW